MVGVTSTGTRRINVGNSTCLTNTSNNDCNNSTSTNIDNNNNNSNNKNMINNNMIHSNGSDVSSSHGNRGRSSDKRQDILLDSTGDDRTNDYANGDDYSSYSEDAMRPNYRNHRRNHSNHQPRSSSRNKPNNGIESNGTYRDRAGVPHDNDDDKLGSAKDDDDDDGEYHDESEDHTTTKKSSLRWNTRKKSKRFTRIPGTNSLFQSYQLRFCYHYFWASSVRRKSNGMIAKPLIIVASLIGIVFLTISYYTIHSHLEYKGYLQKVAQLRRAKEMWSRLQSMHHHRQAEGDTKGGSSINNNHNFGGSNIDTNRSQLHDRPLRQQQQEQLDNSDKTQEEPFLSLHGPDEVDGSIPIADGESWTSHLQQQFDHYRKILISPHRYLVIIQKNQTTNSEPPNKDDDKSGQDDDETNKKVQKIEEDARENIRALLTTWAEQYDYDLINNVNGGTRWIRPYLLPPNPDKPSEYDDDQKHQKKKRRHFKQNRRRHMVSGDNPYKNLFFSHRMNYNSLFQNKAAAQRMKWEDEYDRLLEEGNGTIDSRPSFDYTDPIYYTYPILTDSALKSPPLKDGSYPPLRTLDQLMINFPQDDDYPISNLPIQELLYRLDYQNSTELMFAKQLRDAELPFKLYNVPEVTTASLKWTDEYVTQHFDGQVTRAKTLQQKLTSQSQLKTASSSKQFSILQRTRESPHSHDPAENQGQQRSNKLDRNHRRLRRRHDYFNAINNMRHVDANRVADRGDGLGLRRFLPASFSADGAGATLAKGTAQESVNNYFAFFVPPNWDVETMGMPPVRNNDWTFEKWAQHARYADATKLHADQPHFYWQAGVSPSERLDPDESMWTFISRDLPSFSDIEENFFLFHPEEQKGIQCRFGERGVVAATHYDGGRNMIAMVTGAKRYILSPPNQCSRLGIFTDKKSPIFRHSLLNFGHIRYLHTNSSNINVDNEDDNDDDDESTRHNDTKKDSTATTTTVHGMSKEERAWLERSSKSLAVETILKQGEVLYIPSHWFHYIVSLQKSAQCNVRSGINAQGNPNFGGRNVVERCVD